MPREQRTGEEWSIKRGLHIKNYENVREHYILKEAQVIKNY